MVYTYRGMKFEIETPDEVLLAIIDAEVAKTPEQRADAAELVEGFDAETESLLPGLHQWYRG